MPDHDLSSDEQIVTTVIAGDVDSYGDLMARYEQKLIRYVIYLARDQVSAQDIVQETMIKAYQNLRNFNPKYKFSSWIYRIAHNETMNAIKKDRRINRNVDIEIIEDHSRESDIMHKIDRAILRTDLNICLKKLDVKYREILMLQYFENMKYTEIADVLRIPPSTVGVRASRAKNKLKEICRQKGLNYEQK